MKKLIVGIGEQFYDILPERQSSGGGVMNIVYHAAMQGAEAYLVSAEESNIECFELREELSRTGRSDKYFSPAPELPTGTVAAEPAEAMPCHSMHVPTTGLKILLSKADAICFGMLSYSNEGAASNIIKMLEDVPEKCLKVLDLNMNGVFCSQTAIQNYLRLCNILKLDDEALHLLTGFQAHKSVLKILAERYNIDNIILTRKSEEGIFYDGTSIFAIPALSYNDKENDGGCSDAFTAAFVMALLGDMCPADAVLHAARVATRDVSSYEMVTSENPPGVQDDLGIIMNS